MTTNFNFDMSENPNAAAKCAETFADWYSLEFLSSREFQPFLKFSWVRRTLFGQIFSIFSAVFFQNMLQKHKCYIFYALKPWKTCSTLNFALKNFFMTDFNKDSKKKSWKNLILEHFLHIFDISRCQTTNFETKSKLKIWLFNIFAWNFF